MLYGCVYPVLDCWPVQGVFLPLTWMDACYVATEHIFHSFYYLIYTDSIKKCDVFDKSRWRFELLHPVEEFAANVISGAHRGSSHEQGFSGGCDLYLSYIRFRQNVYNNQQNSDLQRLTGICFLKNKKYLYMNSRFMCV